MYLPIRSVIHHILTESFSLPCPLKEISAVHKLVSNRILRVMAILVLLKS